MPWYQAGSRLPLRADTVRTITFVHMYRNTWIPRVLAEESDTPPASTLLSPSEQRHGGTAPLLPPAARANRPVGDDCNSANEHLSSGRERGGQAAQTASESARLRLSLFLPSLSDHSLHQAAQIDRPHHPSTVPVSKIRLRSARKNNHLNALCGLQQKIPQPVHP